MRNEILNVGVIGVGKMGQEHLRVYSQLRETNLVALSDTNEKQGRYLAAKYGVRYFKNYHEMLDRVNIDALSIAVPTSLHRDVALDCIRRKKPILIEKPIANSIESANQIIKEAERNKVKVTVGHIERFNLVVQELKNVIEQRKLSTITSISTKRVGVYPPRIKDVNVIVDLAVHDIDICNFLIGEKPTAVYARAGKALNSKKFDYASILVKYNGVDALIQVNWITPVKIRELCVTGIRGYAELNYLTQTLRVYENDYKRGYDAFGDYVVQFGSPRIREVSIKEEPLKIELTSFIRYVRDNKPPLVTIQDGLMALAVALKAVESNDKDKVMELRHGR